MTRRLRSMSADKQLTCYLVSCVGRKQGRPLPAKDLYASDWFRKARSYVVSTACPWFILSAEHGLLHPDTVTAPYEKTLNRMAIRERQAWAGAVKAQMDRELIGCKKIVVFAGARYREFLMDYLLRSFEQVSVPLEGLPIGMQLAWFAARTGRGAAK